MSCLSVQGFTAHPTPPPIHPPTPHQHRFSPSAWARWLWRPWRSCRWLGRGRSQRWRRWWRRKTWQVWCLTGSPATEQHLAPCSRFLSGVTSFSWDRKAWVRALPEGTGKKAPSSRCFSQKGWYSLPCQLVSSTPPPPTGLVTADSYLIPPFPSVPRVHQL